MYPLFQSPGEKLSAVCVKSTDGDLDKVLFNLDKEEYQVDTKRRDKAGDGKIDTVILQYCLFMLLNKHLPRYCSSTLPLPTLHIYAFHVFEII